MSEQEIESLVRRAERSVLAARNLRDDGDYDFAISRAYYALFHAVSAMLLSRGIIRSKHSGVIAAFGQEFVRSGEFRAADQRGGSVDQYLPGTRTFALGAGFIDFLLSRRSFTRPPACPSTSCWRRPVSKRSSSRGAQPADIGGAIVPVIDVADLIIAKVLVPAIVSWCSVPGRRGTAAARSCGRALPHPLEHRPHLRFLNS